MVRAKGVDIDRNFTVETTLGDSRFVVPSSILQPLPSPTSPANLVGILLCVIHPILGSLKVVQCIGLKNLHNSVAQNTVNVPIGDVCTASHHSPVDSWLLDVC